jgi:hypothetical protein
MSLESAPVGVAPAAVANVSLVSLVSLLGLQGLVIIGLLLIIPGCGQPI